MKKLLLKILFSALIFTSVTSKVFAEKIVFLPSVVGVPFFNSESIQKWAVDLQTGSISNWMIS